MWLNFVYSYYCRRWLRCITEHKLLQVMAENVLWSYAAKLRLMPCMMALMPQLAAALWPQTLRFFYLLLPTIYLYVCSTNVLLGFFAQPHQLASIMPWGVRSKPPQSNGKRLVVPPQEPHPCCRPFLPWHTPTVQILCSTNWDHPWHPH